MKRQLRLRGFSFACAAIAAMCLASPVIAQDAPPSPTPFIRVIRIEPTKEWAAYRQSISPGNALLRGFRFAMLDHPEDRWPVSPPGPQSPDALREAADIVSKRLAIDGLLPTLVPIIQKLGPANFTADASMDTLKMLGLPVDWLDSFSMDGAAGGGHAIVAEIARRLAAGEDATKLRESLAAGRFEFKASLPGFRLASETGERPISRVRMQLPSADYWRGPGDGSAIDIVRQLIETWPDGEFSLSIEEKNAAAFLTTAKNWPLRRKDQVTLFVMPWPVEQWAQDNGKPGFAADETKGHPVPALLVPRYANRGEERTALNADESLTVRALSASGLRLVSSPLIFQGGNLLPARDPATGKLTLLIGEAEVYRNTAQGLSREQVIEAFRIECGADRCVVLPAVSFHLDFEVSARVREGKIIAFVNDERAAARIMLSQGADALVRLGAIDAATAQNARARLSEEKDQEALELLAGPSGRLAQSGVFPAAAARPFSVGPADSGAANLQRYLLSLDILASHTARIDDLPPDAMTRAYAISLQRRHRERMTLHRALEELGWRIFGVPSLADEDRSVNYLNGFQEPGRYVMPAWGGFYRPLDEAAAKAVRQAVEGAVNLDPIHSSESQRRLGAIHCSASVWPESDQ